MFPRYDERVEQLARDEQNAPPFLGDELDQVLHLRLAHEASVGIAEENDVVGEKALLGGRKRRHRGTVLLAVGRVGRQQHDIQVDGLVALEIILQVAELVTRLGVDIKNLELLLAHRDRALDAVVIRLKFARQRIDLDDELAFAGRLGPIDELDPLRLTAGRGVDFDCFDLARGLGIARARLAAP